jgi:hypothetical protein
MTGLIRQQECLVEDVRGGMGGLLPLPTRRRSNMAGDAIANRACRAGRRKV